MSSHSKLGPSAAKRWINCPASVLLSANEPKEKTSVHAAEGQVAHSVAEKLIQGEELPPLGTVIRQEGHDIVIDQDMYDGAEEYRYSVEEARRYFSEINPVKGKPVVEKLEGKVGSVSMDPDKGEVWGRADYFSYRKGDTLFVFDYKYGRRGVDPVENEQCCTYAVAVMDQEAGWAFNRVVIRIIQPRDFTSKEAMKEWVTTPEWLKKWRDEKAIPAVRATRIPGGTPNPGPWCTDNYCPIRAKCPALVKAVGAAAQTDFAVGPALVVRDVKLIPTEEQERLLQHRGMVDGFFKALEADLQGKAELGERLKFWKLVEGRAGHRKWKDEKAVVRMFGNEALENKVLSPAALEKALKLKPEDIAMLTERPPGKKTLAPLDDKRETVRGAQDDFAPVCPNCEMGLCRTHRKTAKRVWPE